MSVNFDLTSQVQSTEDGLNVDYMAYPENGIDTTAISGLIGSSKYYGGVSLGNLIFLVPYDADHVAIIDTVNKTIDTTTIPAPAGLGKWRGAIRAWNNKAYFVPYNFPFVGILDMVALTLDVTTIASPVVGSNLWSGGFLAPNNGCIYCPPHDSSNGPLKINPHINTATNIGAGSLNPVAKFESAVLSSHNGLGYAVPRNSTFVGIINPFNDTWDTTTITGLVGVDKWRGGAEGTDQKIYCASQTSNSVLIIEPKTDTIDTMAITGAEIQGHSSANLMPNKKIYMMPSLSSNVTIIDTDTQIADTLTIAGLGAGAKFDGGSVCSSQGELFGVPFDETYVPIVRVGFPEISLDVCTSAYDNKY